MSNQPPLLPCECPKSSTGGKRHHPCCSNYPEPPAGWNSRPTSPVTRSPLADFEGDTRGISEYSREELIAEVERLSLEASQPTNPKSLRELVPAPKRVMQPKPQQSDEGLREALEFYAKPRNWELHREKHSYDPDCGRYDEWTPAIKDNGHTARAALSRQAPVPTSGAVEWHFGPDSGDDSDYWWVSPWRGIGVVIMESEVLWFDTEDDAKVCCDALNARSTQPPAADGKLEMLEKWHKLPEPRCRKVDGEGPNAAKHNAKVAADLEDGKTYLMYDHHRSSFWGPKQCGYEFRKGAGHYTKEEALKVLERSSRYFTAEEVPADILAALAQPAGGGETNTTANNASIPQAPASGGGDA